MSLIETYTAKERALRDAKFMECRANFRHTMRRRPGPPPHWERPYGRRWRAAKYLLHKQCVDCGTWRHMAIGYSGALLAFEYQWPDGYRREPGEGRMSADEIRLWEIEQVANSKAPSKRLRAV